jgi:hypothetical protein
MRAMVLERVGEPSRSAELPVLGRMWGANEALDSIRDGALRGAPVL